MSSAKQKRVCKVTTHSYIQTDVFHKRNTGAWSNYTFLCVLSNSPVLSLREGRLLTDGVATRLAWKTHAFTLEPDSGDEHVLPLPPPSHQGGLWSSLAWTWKEMVVSSFIFSDCLHLHCAPSHAYDLTVCCIRTEHDIKTYCKNRTNYKKQN